MATGVEDPKLRAAYNAALAAAEKSKKYKDPQDDPAVKAARASLGAQRASVGLNVNQGGPGVANAKDNPNTVAKQNADANKAAFNANQANVAIQGTETKPGSTTIGDVREIAGPQIDGINIDPAAQATAATINTAQTDDDRARQLQLASALQNTITNPNAPSVAQTQLQAATDRNIAQQAALVASQPGMNPALATRQAQLQSALTQQQANQNAAILRANEVATAQGQLGAVNQQVAGNDQTLAQNNATLQQNVNLANQTATNSRATSQADLSRQIALANAQTALTAAQSNQTAFNNRNLSQADIARALQQAQLAANTSVKTAQIGANASIANANTAANASKYNADTSLIETGPAKPDPTV